LERVLDDLAFEAPSLGATTVPITAAYVRERLDGILKDEDLSAVRALGAPVGVTSMAYVDGSGGGVAA